MFAVLIDDFVFNGNEQVLVVMDGKCHVMSCDLIMPVARSYQR